MKNLLSSILIGLASLNSALAHNLQDAVEDFTLCDGKFFRTLKNSEVEWSMHVSLENSEKICRPQGTRPTGSCKKYDPFQQTGSNSRSEFSRIF